MNGYMPNDNYRVNIVDAEFDETVDYIEQMYSEMADDMNDVILVGDLNIDLVRNKAHTKHLCDISSRHGLNFGKNHQKTNYEYTYVHEGANHKSNIDHYVLPTLLYECVDSIKCTDNRLNPSFHRTLLIKFNININKIRIGEGNFTNKSIAWHRVNDQHIATYQDGINAKLQTFQVPKEAILCRNVLCGNEKHSLDLSKYCESLISICVQSGETCFPKVRHKENSVPYWSEEVQSLKDNALLWHDIWQHCGKSRDGVVAQIMRRVRHKYHYTLRSIKKNDTMLRKSRMAEALGTGGDSRDFLKELDKMVGRSRQIPP